MAAGLLFATMEPPANIEEEFQDWYDTEHFPERQSCPGFLTAHRFVCIDGWPRYLAMYDLEDVEVLRGEGYRKIAHERYSAWTHRIIAKVTGQISRRGCAGVSRLTDFTAGRDVLRGRWCCGFAGSPTRPR